VDHTVAGFVAPFGDAGLVDEDGAAVDGDGEAAAFQGLHGRGGGRRGERKKGVCILERE